jgi:hypothetical protein
MATREQIEAAIEKFTARGDEPSVRKVWDELGKSGSFSQVNPVLSAWRRAQAARSAAGSPVPDALTETAIALVTKCWTPAEKKAVGDAQDARRGADQRIVALEQEAGGLKEALEESEFLVVEQKQENVRWSRSLPRPNRSCSTFTARSQLQRVKSLCFENRSRTFPASR